MNKPILILCSIVIISCATGEPAKPRGWQLVRIIEAVPPNCEYIMQEACRYVGGTCLQWYQKRAHAYGADRVVLLDIGAGQASRGKSGAAVGSYGGFASSKHASGRTYPLAEYYKCNKIVPANSAPKENHE